MPFFPKVQHYYAATKDKINGMAQGLWKYKVVQTVWSGATAAAVKIKETSLAQYLWKTDVVQATWQGLLAPVHAQTSLVQRITLSEDVDSRFNASASARKRIDAAEDLGVVLTRTVEYNYANALRAFVAYFIYYRVLEPLESYYKPSDQNEAEVDNFYLFVQLIMHAYLFSHLIRSIAQNFAYTSVITYMGAKSTPESSDFKSCACSKTQIIRADGDSLVFYLGGRYAVNLLSQAIAKNSPGLRGSALSFALESAFYGWFLVDYKFSAIGKCTEHRLKEIFGSYKMYSLMFGVSFVTLTWGSSGVVNKMVGAENPYVYDAIFSVMFQFYALLAIIREKAFPGNDSMTIDLVAAMQWMMKAPFVPFLVETFLGELASLDKLVQSPGVSLLLTVRENEITDSLSAMESGLNQVERLESNFLLSSAQWAGKYLPFNVIPAKVKDVYGFLDKRVIGDFVAMMKSLQNKARVAEEKRGAYRRIKDVPKMQFHCPPAESKTLIEDAMAQFLPEDAGRDVSSSQSASFNLGQSIVDNYEQGSPSVSSSSSTLFSGTSLPAKMSGTKRSFAQRNAALISNATLRSGAARLPGK